MTTTPTGIIVEATGDSLGTILNSLASGGTAISAAIDNTAATVGHAPYDIADVQLVFASTTMGSGSPFIQAAIVAALDGTNYETWGLSNSQIFPIPGSASEPLLPSTAYTTIRIKGLILPPALFKVAFYYNGGTTPPALPASVTATLYRMQGGIG